MINREQIHRTLLSRNTFLKAEFNALKDKYLSFDFDFVVRF